MGSFVLCMLGYNNLNKDMNLHLSKGGRLQ